MSKLKEVIGCKHIKDCEADTDLVETTPTSMLTRMCYTCCTFCPIKGGCPDEDKQCKEVPDTCDGVVAG